ncbi:hypothetical protein [Natronoglycomyces albus]|uniref:Uncharacterized protein n=1 Tax=Natronoglycomyces albus TaxID=2811108 RepID=A0A895XSH6_9ACTN|nr:hypothetical protein [Natronoglycomyces albus]QSB06279.1 hypothetical protein JQS30_05055 [Natronoglycomyces albus]
MPKLIRIVLHVLQAMSLLASLIYALMYVLIAEGLWSSTQLVTWEGPYGAIIFGILAIAFSPSLWSSRRVDTSAAAPAGAIGSYEAVSAPPNPQPSPQYYDTTAVPPDLATRPTAQAAAPAIPPATQPSAPPQPTLGQPTSVAMGQPQAGSGYAPEAAGPSQFAPRHGEPGGPPIGQSPPEHSNSLHNPKSPWS